MVSDLTYRRIGILLFGLGALLLVGILALGKFFIPELAGPTPRPLAELRGTSTMLRVASFGIGFPAGLALCLVGAAVAGAARGRRAALLAFATIVAVGSAAPLAALAGAAPSRIYFGGGGVVILVLLATGFWIWGRWRGRLPEAARGGADLVALGHLCLGIAAWHICGTAALPGFALDPERAAALGTAFLAARNLRVTMAFLVLGWLLTLLGLRVASRR